MNDITVFATFLLLIFCITYVVNSYLRLRHIPGPFLAKFNDLWRLYYMNRPGYGQRLVELHRQYGPIMRLGPNHISMADPDMVGPMFGTNPVWEKARSYQGAAPFSKGKAFPSVVSMTEAQSTVVHRVAGAAFTANALLDYEDLVDQSCAAILKAFKTRESPIDLSWWFNLFAMDVINRIAFSDSLGFLETGEDVQNLMAATKERFDHWGHWHAIPGVENFIFKSPFARLFPWGRRGPSALAAAAQNKLDLRMDPSNAEKYHDRPDLLGKFLAGSAKYPGLVTDKEILGMTQSTIGAGADTTAATLAIIYIYLSRHAEVMKKFKNEIDSANLSDPPTWEEVRSLPYLEAVIKEAMRILPVSQWDHSRTVPIGGWTIAGEHVPSGTTVQCHIDSIQRNADIFGPSPDSYIPERWIGKSDEQLVKMNQCMLGFGSGKRMCLGRHIAWLEMKKLLPLLTLHLDIQILNPDIDVNKDIEGSAVRYTPPLPASVRLREKV